MTRSVGGRQQIAWFDRSAGGVRLHVNPARQGDVLPAFHQPLLLHLNSGIDAVGAADDPGDAGVVRLVTYFQVAGVLLVNHNHRALRDFMVGGRNWKRFGEVGAAFDREGTAVEVHVTVVRRVV